MIRTEERTEAEKATKRGIQDLALGRSDLFRMDPRTLTVEPGLNSRTHDFSPDDDEDIALARSIAEVGVKSALTVYMRDGVPVVTDGHRRLAATLYALDVLGAEIRSVPVQTEAKFASEADRVLSQIVRNSGKPLQPIEKANVFAKLMDLGWDEVEIGKKAGVSRQYVTDLLALRAAPREVVEMVRSGTVSATLARQTLRSSGDEAGQVLEAAVTKAKAAGKERATAQHVERPARYRRTFADGVRFAIEIARTSAGVPELVSRLETEIGG